VEADKINEKIKQIKNTLRLKKKRNLEGQHSAEHGQLEENLQKESEIHGGKWEQKMKEFEENSRKMEEDMNLRHKNEMETLAKHLEANANTNNVKYPPEYLHLRRSEMILSRQQRFKEAEFVKQKRIQIEKNEMEKHGKTNNNKFKGKLEKLAHKQLLEKQALRKKIESTLDAFEKERKLGEDNLQHKYRNRRQELLSQQHQERLLSENENLLKKKTTTGKFSGKPQRLMGKTSTGEGFNSSSGHKQKSVKNYSPKSNDDFQNDNYEKGTSKYEDVHNLKNEEKNQQEENNNSQERQENPLKNENYQENPLNNENHQENHHENPLNNEGPQEHLEVQNEEIHENFVNNKEEIQIQQN